MKRRNRRILLLVDNAPTHLQQVTLENVRVEKLPPNTTAHLQPCDAGIIHSFKCQYKRIFVEDRLVAFDQMKASKSATFMLKFTH